MGNLTEIEIAQKERKKREMGRERERAKEGGEQFQKMLTVILWPPQGCPLRCPGSCKSMHAHTKR